MSLHPTRDSYMPRAETLVPVDCTGTDAAVYTYDEERSGKTLFFAIAFHGKAAKPDWHYRFGNSAARARKISEYLDGRKGRAEMMAQVKAERSAPHTLKVGDVLVCTWGYDQTNVDYYQVTRVPGAQTVEIRKIAAHSAAGEDGFMTASCTANRDRFVGEPMIKRASAGNSVRIASYAHAHPWDGKADRYSWYA